MSCCSNAGGSGGVGLLVVEHVVVRGSTPPNGTNAPDADLSESDGHTDADTLKHRGQPATDQILQ